MKDFKIHDKNLTLNGNMFASVKYTEKMKQGILSLLMPD